MCAKPDSDNIKENTGKIVGRVFGRLTVKSTFKNGNTWESECICECGNVSKTANSNLYSGRTMSCGCMNKEITSARMTTHGMTKSKTYSVYRNMIKRCYNTKSNDYAYYGGRGITVCPRWVSSFHNFLMDMGEVPINKQLDRIDNNGNYAPSNCRWATRKENCRNKRDTKKYLFNGLEKTIGEWSDIMGIKHHTLYARLYNKRMPIEMAMTPMLFRKGR